jgi:DNA-binding NarL/FixJ family response regulator
MPIRVLIVDDHQLIRDALTDLFAATEDIEPVGSCADGGEVATAVERTRPDVILMDLQMPWMDGLTAARAVLADHPEVRIVVLSGGLTDATAREASGLGVAGYLLKDDDPVGLSDHVRAVAAGGTAWHPLVAALLEAGPNPTVDPPTPPVPSPYVDDCPPRFRLMQ